MILYQVKKHASFHSYQLRIFASACNSFLNYAKRLRGSPFELHIVYIEPKWKKLRFRWKQIVQEHERYSTLVYESASIVSEVKYVQDPACDEHKRFAASLERLKDEFNLHLESAFDEYKALHAWVTAFVTNMKILSQEYSEKYPAKWQEVQKLRKQQKEKKVTKVSSLATFSKNEVISLLKKLKEETADLLERTGAAKPGMSREFADPDDLRNIEEETTYEKMSPEEEMMLSRRLNAAMMQGKAKKQKKKSEEAEEETTEAVKRFKAEPTRTKAPSSPKKSTSPKEMKWSSPLEDGSPSHLGIHQQRNSKRDSLSLKDHIQQQDDPFSNTTSFRYQKGHTAPAYSNHDLEAWTSNVDHNINNPSLFTSSYQPTASDTNYIRFSVPRVVDERVELHNDHFITRNRLERMYRLETNKHNIYTYCHKANNNAFSIRA